MTKKTVSPFYFFIITSLALISVTLIGCSERRNSRRHADKNIKNSFRVADSQANQANTKSTLSTPNYTSVNWAKPNSTTSITIQKSALDKEFLLQSQLIQILPSPQFNGLKSRIVVFSKKGSRLLMFESTKGHVRHNDIPANILITEFPIVSENNDEIEFNFNDGMSQLFTVNEWRGQDFMGTAYNPNLEFTAVDIALSYLQSAEFNNNNQLSLLQVAQIKIENQDTHANLTVHARYYLSPYAENLNFQPTESHNFLRFGFFEIAPLVRQNDAEVIYATKFDLIKKIKWYVSANTPAEYRQAVKDGILYWNKALGENTIEVADAPEGMSAPDINHNIFQWVSNSPMFGAYADGQADPRTGELLHAQIFFSAGVTVWGHMIFDKQSKLTAQNQIGLSGFNSNRLCDYDFAQAAQTRTNIIMSMPDGEARKRAVNDFIRSIAAHEVGHTLGLRHNFAGSLITNVPNSERDVLRKNYFTNQLPSDTVVASTVMDYLQDVNEFIVGSLLNKNERALPYDEAAIKKLYKSQDTPDAPLFCTDSTADSNIIDCLRRDYGASPVEYISSDFLEKLQMLPHFIMSSFIAAKAPLFSTPVQTLDEVAPNGETYLNQLFNPRVNLLRGFTNEASILKIQRKNAAVGFHNKTVIKKDELNYLANEITRLGGFDKVIPSLPVGFVAQQMMNLEALIASGIYDEGVNSTGKKFSFSKADYDVVRKTAQQLFTAMEHKSYTLELQALLGNVAAVTPSADKTNTATDAPEHKKFLEHDVTNELAVYFKSVVSRYLLTTTEKKITATITGKNADTDKDTDAGKNEVTVTVELPQFLYPADVRLKSLTLLNSERARELDWGLHERAQIAKSFDELMKLSLKGLDLSSLKAADYPRPIARWIFEQQKIKSLISLN